MREIDSTQNLAMAMLSDGLCSSTLEWVDDQEVPLLQQPILRFRRRFLEGPEVNPEGGRLLLGWGRGEMKTPVGKLFEALRNI